jgi:ankyrin repeat protein
LKIIIYPTTTKQHFQPTRTMTTKTTNRVKGHRRTYGDEDWILNDMILDKDFELIRQWMPKFTRKQLVFRQEKGGHTMLHLACDKKIPFDIVKGLVARGLDVNGKTTRGDSVLHGAVASNSTLEIIKYLLDSGADVNYCTVRMTALLHALVDKGKRDIALLLLDYGASPHRIDGTGAPPFFFAIKHDASIDVIRKFLQKGADLTGQQGNMSVLHLAALCGSSVEVVKLLLTWGADPKALDLEDGLTPLQFCLASRHQHLIPILTNPPPSKFAAKQIVTISQCAFCSTQASETHRYYFNVKVVIPFHIVV